MKSHQVSMPKLVQVANHQKSETVDARDHALWKTVLIWVGQIGFSTTWGLDTMDIRLEQMESMMDRDTFE
jgi:hypothetical protein